MLYGLPEAARGQRRLRRAQARPEATAAGACEILGGGGGRVHHERCGVLSTCPCQILELKKAILTYFLSLVIRYTLKQGVWSKQQTELLLLYPLHSRGHSNLVYRSMKQAIICRIVRTQNMCMQLQVQTSHARGKAQNSKNGPCTMALF